MFAFTRSISSSLDAVSPGNKFLYDISVKTKEAHQGIAHRLQPTLKL